MNDQHEPNFDSGENPPAHQLEQGSGSGQSMQPPLPPPGRYQPWSQQPPGPRGYAALGWILIILGALIMIGLPHLEKLIAKTPAAETEDEIGLVMMDLQGKIMIGGVAIQQGEAGLMYVSAEKTLNMGTVAQRQRFAVLAAEMAGPAEARDILIEIDDLVHEAIAKRDESEQAKVGELIFVEGIITGPQAAAQQMLHQMYDVDEGGWEEVRSNIQLLDDKQVELLCTELGWFGELALAPRAGDDFFDAELDPPARQEIVGRANTVMFGLVALMFVLGGVGLIGFIGLIILIVFMFTRRIQTGFGPGRVHHGLYAETFGIWIFSFPILQVAASVVALFKPHLAMPAVVFMFFASLGALFWPVLRGARWGDVRADIGWTFGRSAIAQPFFGIAGYAMALPMLAAGIGMTYILIQLQLVFTPIGEPLAPAGGPAHPIMTQLGGPDIWPKVIILFLAAVAAPIVEETMFRGVLYRHLRDATHKIGFFLSVVISGLINAFVFAAIHPQGWVAIPALMSLALAFTLLREWRGSVVPAMFVHGISNFIVISLVIAMLSI